LYARSASSLFWKIPVTVPSSFRELFSESIDLVMILKVRREIVFLFLQFQPREHYASRKELPGNQYEVTTIYPRVLTAQH
jgi:hypothetical protein